MEAWLEIATRNASLAIKAIASEYKIPAIGGGAVDTLGIPADPYFFKVAPAARDFMVVLADYAKARLRPQRS